MGDGAPENKPGESPAAADDDDSFAYSDGYESLSHDSQRDVDSTSAGTATKAVTSAAHQLQALYMSRIAVAVLLVLAITAAGVTTFFMADRTQQDHLDTQFDDAAQRILDRAHLVLENALDMYTAMAAAMVGMAANNASWPFYTQGHFEEFGQSFLKGSSADLVAWSPIVQGETNRDNWGTYSAANTGWIEEGLVWQAANQGLEMPQGPFDVPATIYTKDRSGKTSPVTGTGPFLPVWQMAGAPSSPSVINFDLLSDPVFATTFDGVVNQGSQVFSKIIPDASIYYGASAQTKDRGDGIPMDDDIPQGLLMTPLRHHASSHEVVGVLVAVLSWNTFFEQCLQSGTPKITVVVSDGGCGNTFTLAVTGEQVWYVGEGENHDRKYANMVVSTTLATEETSYMDCGYTVSVYPTNAFITTYVSNQPALWAVFVCGIMFIVGIAFFAYDLYVQKRHVKSVNSAARLNAMVASLFPEEVRDRLFNNHHHDVKDTTSERVDRKSRLSNFLSNMSEDEHEPDDAESCDNSISKSKRQEEAVPNGQLGVDMYQTKPIADLFPNSTIMFADIAGFTAWSSVREPSQVFTLLETVYQSFDVIAKRRKVFKVETVGDCYVAVAGLPEPRPDHAVVMAKFARECLDRFNELAKKLEITLGPDTADLAMRAGLHSGPVTAGVLRGDKSRFQLFGDTVNVAARVEGTGMRNRIHMSSETAELLMKAGKEHWCRKRPELVTAKGKTAIQTYWLQSHGEAQDEPVDSAERKAYNRNISLDELEDSLPPKVKRLVGWNVEILKKLLQQIVAKRDASGKKRNHDALLARMEVAYGKKQYLLDEVKEIISLPKFDVRAHRKKAEKGDLSTEVVEQLKLYVSAIAAMHRENPFHNFEHASHVTMSVSKLLTRIVAPDEMMSYQEEEGAGLAASLHDNTYGITSDPLTQFSCVLSALIHDTDHAGVSNMQLVKEGSALAKFFKEKSVAEQNSIAVAWEKLMDPRFAELRKCIYAEPSELDRFRQLIVNNVLATDLFDKELQSVRKKRWDMAFQRLASTSDSSALDDVNRKATVVMEHLIQASDVAHTMQHWHIYQKWNERLFAEMMAAFKSGRMGSDPSENWYQGELGFFDNYIIPLANKLKECGVFGVSSDEYLNYALENRREWANKGEEVVARYISKYRADEGEKTDS